MNDKNEASPEFIFVDPKNDVAFRKIFGDEKKKEILISFLNNILEFTGANGIHTIQWTASDNAGNTDGIGSRYFMIHNPGGSTRHKAGAFNSQDPTFDTDHIAPHCPSIMARKPASDLGDRSVFRIRPNIRQN